MVEAPTPAFKGSPLGPELLVLSLPQIRSAQLIVEPTRFDTRDGLIVVQPGDVAITAYGKEQYPIHREVFLGAYEVLGRVEQDLVAERLIHVRRAWEVLGDGGSFDYGPGRGIATVERGSWLYQSSDDDFGTVGAEVKHQGHLLVGPADAADRTDWHARTERITNLLGALPPLLILLALSSWVATMHHAANPLPASLVALEVVLLVAGAATVWTMKRRRWFLRACVQRALSLGPEFASAVALLGHARSRLFPGMALWRAAQSRSLDADESRPSTGDDASLLQTLHDALVRRLRMLDDEIHHAHRREAIASWATVIAFGLVLLGNLSLLYGVHATAIEMLVIWVPALLSAVHAFDLRRRTAERVAALRELGDRLRFAQSRLRADGGSSGPARDAALRVICVAAARFSQRELKMALAAEAPLPV